MVGSLRLPVLTTAFAALAHVGLASPSNITVDGRRLLVDGKPVHLKGVDWNPVPKGAVHPQGLDYSGSVVRDAALMRAAGINALRSYECICDLEVLDVLWNHSIFVLNTVFANANENLTSVVDKVNAVKDHPAVLMWVVGNEWNYNGCYANLTPVECMAFIAKSANTVKAHDTTHPVATIYGRLPSAEVLEELSIIDVWGINYYYGLGFNDSGLGGGGDLFQEWANRASLPMFIAEYGADAWDTFHNGTDYAAQAKAVTTLSQKIMDSSTLLEGGVCLGGMLFEFADEWWKDSTGNASTQDHTGFNWGGGPYADFRYNEEWWGLVDIDRNARPAYYAYGNVTAPTECWTHVRNATSSVEAGSTAGQGRHLAGSLHV